MREQRRPNRRERAREHKEHTFLFGVCKRVRARREERDEKLCLYSVGRGRGNKERGDKHARPYALWWRCVSFYQLPWHCRILPSTGRHETIRTPPNLSSPPVAPPSPSRRCPAISTLSPTARSLPLVLSLSLSRSLDLSISLSLARSPVLPISLPISPSLPLPGSRSHRRR